MCMASLPLDTCMLYIILLATLPAEYKVEGWILASGFLRQPRGGRDHCSRAALQTLQKQEKVVELATHMNSHRQLYS